MARDQLQLKPTAGSILPAGRNRLPTSRLLTFSAVSGESTCS